MCGIVGYTGHNNCVPILLDGLRRLEYRGYDSAGIAVHDDALHVCKTKGRINNLATLLEQHPLYGAVGIGHTRWATHGEPSDCNSHPHLDGSERIAIVHNGIIENYYKLKGMLESRGVVFVSDTDTEVIAQLLGYYYDGDMISTLYTVMKLLEGSFALAILCKDTPGTIYCTRKDSPLVVGKGEEGSFLASDIPAMLTHTREIYLLENFEVAQLSTDSILFYDEFGLPVRKQPLHIDWDVAAAEKSGYEHFMLKEIHEEPEVLRSTLQKYVDTDAKSIRPEFMGLSEKQALAIQRIGIIACGTAYHAGIVGKAILEKLLRIPVAVDIASEFRYSDPIVHPGDIYFVISQSGETADTIAAMRKIQQLGGIVIAICNVVGSTIAREADHVIYTLAGPEIAVASTKAYTTQLMVLYIIAVDLANKRGCIQPEKSQALLGTLQTVPDAVSEVLENKSRIQYFASRTFDSNHVFFIGRGFDNALSMEAALKLKEISYIHSEAYAAGELKHGTIALIEEGKLVVAMATQPGLTEKMASNIREVKVRGARVLSVVNGDCPVVECESDETWHLPYVDPFVIPMVAIVPMQLFAYYMALGRGCDIDKPRNLAKSVTVE